MQEAQNEIARDWYEDWFSRKEYELVYKRRGQSDAVRVLELLQQAVAPRPGARILDLACGRGRHAIALARLGFDVTGVDLSEDVIKQARLRAIGENVRVQFLQGDMRSPLENGRFDGVVNLFTSFGYFNDDFDHARSIYAVATMLVEGGWFFQDFLNAAYVEENLVPYDERVDGDVTILQHRWIAEGRVNKEIILQRSGEVHTFTESVRLLTLDDFSRWYGSAGLEIIDIFGNYDGQPFSDAVPRLILHARKRRDT